MDAVEVERDAFAARIDGEDVRLDEGEWVRGRLQLEVDLVLVDLRRCVELLRHGCSVSGLQVAQPVLVDAFAAVATGGIGVRHSTVAAVSGARWVRGVRGVW